MTNHQLHDDQSFLSMVIENFVYFYVDYIIKKFRIGLTEIKTITGIMTFLTVSSAVALFAGMRQNNNAIMGATMISTPILFTVLLIVLLFWYRKNLIMNPRFLTKPRDGKVLVSIPNIMVPKPTSDYDMSIHFWVYISDWNYRRNNWKNLINKGPPINNQSRSYLLNEHPSGPAVYITPKNNNLMVVISTESGVNSSFTVDNIPIRKWFDVAIVTRYRSIDIFVNGKIEKTGILDSPPVFNDHELRVNDIGGHAGLIAAINYYTRALNPYDIGVKHMIGPYVRIYDIVTKKLDVLGVMDNKKPIENVSGTHIGTGGLKLGGLSCGDKRKSR